MGHLQAVWLRHYGSVVECAAELASCLMSGTVAYVDSVIKEH
jgi:hypothetical protein